MPPSAALVFLGPLRTPTEPSGRSGRESGSRGAACAPAGTPGATCSRRPRDRRAARAGGSPRAGTPASSSARRRAWRSGRGRRPRSGLRSSGRSRGPPSMLEPLLSRLGRAGGGVTGPAQRVRDGPRAARPDPEQVRECGVGDEQGDDACRAPQSRQRGSADFTGGAHRSPPAGQPVSSGGRGTAAGAARARTSTPSRAGWAATAAPARRDRRRETRRAE